jgi:DNA repair protein RecO
MYTIHTTPGFIISSQPYGEAGKLLHVFTREIGLIMAGAQGLRLEKSKLRYSSQDFSFGQYSFVRGKEFWRLTDAKLHKRIINKEFCARLGLLLKRLLHGEDPHPELFDCISECVDFIENHPLDKEAMQTLESLIVARVLFRLGYIGHDAELNGHLDSNQFTEELLGNLKEKRLILNKHINKAFKESHL